MTDLGIREFDLGEVLTSTDSIAAFVQGVAEDADNDAGAIIRAFRVAVRAHGASTVAPDAGLSLKALDEAPADGGNPSFEAILNIAHALGLRVSFERTS